MTEVIHANSHQVASKVMDGEAILINLSTGIYYSLDDTAGLIWSYVEHGTTAETIVDALCAQYGLQRDAATADVEKFVNELKEEGLLLVGSESDLGTGDAPTDMPAGDYAAPAMEKFTDMADMFALDPPLPGLAGQAN